MFIINSLNNWVIKKLNSILKELLLDNFSEKRCFDITLILVNGFQTSNSLFALESNLRRIVK